MNLIDTLIYIGIGLGIFGLGYAFGYAQTRTVVRYAELEDIKPVWRSTFPKARYSLLHWIVRASVDKEYTESGSKTSRTVSVYDDTRYGGSSVHFDADDIPKVIVALKAAEKAARSAK